MTAVDTLVLEVHPPAPPTVDDLLLLELDLLGFDGDLPAEPDRAEPDWRDRALSAQTDPEAFFPEKGGSTREAKRICSGCEVRAECLDYAPRRRRAFRRLGGLSERERRHLRRAEV